MTLEELRELAKNPPAILWEMDDYAIINSLVYGTARCLSDPRFLTDRQQEALMPSLDESVLAEIDTALALRAAGVSVARADTPPKIV